VLVLLHLARSGRRDGLGSDCVGSTAECDHIGVAGVGRVELRVGVHERIGLGVLVQPADGHERHGGHRTEQRAHRPSRPRAQQCVGTERREHHETRGDDEQQAAQVTGAETRHDRGEPEERPVRRRDAEREQGRGGEERDHDAPAPVEQRETDTAEPRGPDRERSLDPALEEAAVDRASRLREQHELAPRRLRVALEGRTTGTRFVDAVGSPAEQVGPAQRERVVPFEAVVGQPLQIEDPAARRHLGRHQDRHHVRRGERAAEREPEADRQEATQAFAARFPHREEEGPEHREPGRLQAHDDEPRRPRQAGPQSEPPDRAPAWCSRDRCGDEVVHRGQHRPHRQGRGQDHVVVQLALRPRAEHGDDEAEQRALVLASDPAQEQPREVAEQHEVHEIPPAIPLLARQQEQQQVDRFEWLRHLRHERRAAADVACPARPLRGGEPVLHDAVPAQRLQVLVGHAEVAAIRGGRIERAVRDRLGHVHVEQLHRVRHECAPRQQAVAQEQDRTQECQPQRGEVLAPRRRSGGGRHGTTMQHRATEHNDGTARTFRGKSLSATPPRALS
jgi:hypothetical protein